MDSIADSRGGMGTSALAAAITAILYTTAPLASADVVPGTQSDVHFESSQLVGSGRDINALRLPVVDVKSGRVDYYDTRFRLSLVDGAFVMKIIGASKSPAVLGFDNITPGVYQDSNDACYGVGGPTLLPDGRRGTVLATNVYRLTENGWRIVLHHGSPAGGGPAPAGEEPPPRMH